MRSRRRHHLYRPAERTGEIRGLGRGSFFLWEGWEGGKRKAPAPSGAKVAVPRQSYAGGGPYAI